MMKLNVVLVLVLVAKIVLAAVPGQAENEERELNYGWSNFNIM